MKRIFILLTMALVLTFGVKAEKVTVDKIASINTTIAAADTLIVYTGNLSPEYTESSILFEVISADSLLLGTTRDSLEIRVYLAQFGYNGVQLTAYTQIDSLLHTAGAQRAIYYSNSTKYKSTFRLKIQIVNSNAAAQTVEIKGYHVRYDLYGRME